MAVRWVVSLPWRFRFSDAIGPLGLFVAFHFLVTAVGTGRWFGAQGLNAVGSSIIYPANARRAISLSSRPAAASRTALLIPAPIRVAIGVASLVVGVLSEVRSLSAAAHLVLNVLVAVGIVAFAVTDYRVWRHLADLARCS